MNFFLIFNYSQNLFRQANERREVAEKRSTSARNDYLLYISAMNAHQTKYYALDLPDLIAVSVFFFKYIQFYLKKYYTINYFCVIASFKNEFKVLFRSCCEFREWIFSAPKKSFTSTINVFIVLLCY